MSDYETIVRALRFKKLDSTETALDRCVHEETDALTSLHGHSSTSSSVEKRPNRSMPLRSCRSCSSPLP